ncbi:transcription termination factor 1-like [Engraulis encrasicolus]|uniref:transcription termination factor 1-like n=1 Tax=Engraulis encrasicolus TaxID=184585 RepID=UPI002FD55342
MEVELEVHKKKKKKSKKHLTEAPSDTHHTPDEESLHKKHNKKKKKTKDGGRGDDSAAEFLADLAERKMMMKKKNRHKEEKVDVNSGVMEDSSRQEREETKKRKKRRIVETGHLERDKKKKKTKDGGSGDGSAAEFLADLAERKMMKKKSRPKGEKVDVNSAMLEEDSRCQEREETKKRKKRRIEETGHLERDKKKKKTKVSGSGDGSSGFQADGAERKMKKNIKHKGEKVGVNSVVMEDSRCQEMGETKKRKKRRIEETEHPVEREKGAEVTVTPMQTSGEAAGQNSAKSKSEKPRKRTETSPATGTQPHTSKTKKEKFYGLNKEAILQEIKEYIPNVIATDSESIYQFKMYDLPRFREFKKQGMPIRTGKFTQAEIKRLKQNVKDFLALSGIESETKLFMPRRFPDEKDIFRRRRKLGFIMCLCEGIPRPSISIRIRAQHLFNRENFLGRFTDKENHDLLNLYKLHGRKWSLISEKMGRSPAAVKGRFILMCEGRGPWTEEELRTLLTSVRQHLLKRATPGEDGSIGAAVIRKVDLYKQLPWVNVSKQVQTRSWLYCRTKWMQYLTCKMRTGSVIKGRKTLESQIQLIKAINEMVVEDAADIVWDDLTHLFGNAHPAYLQMRFHQLKVAHVPGWNTMEDFCDVIDHLYEKTLPQLEEELKNCREEEEEPTEERDSYRLSEIFPDL